ncbi:GntR family transcriptional regulator [Micromonospora sp. NPDC005206]|uniref:GntR family transcriptional regulator n=1 Tax=Micromonospora sp. NPDC005206 TaxID=3157022 RepID=UPI0033A0ED66
MKPQEDGARVSPSGATASVEAQLKRMLLGGELVPGEQIRQEFMASRLGVSRVPVREALRHLAAIGMLTHIPNVGYMVAKLSSAQVEQVYLLRKVLEDPVLDSLPPATQDQLDTVESFSKAVAEAAERHDVVELRNRNRDFHFAIFAISPLDLLVEELDKVWTWASLQSAYLFSPGSHDSLFAEHRDFVEALQVGDNDALKTIMDRSRDRARKQVRLLLCRSAPRDRGTSLR